MQQINLYHKTLKKKSLVFSFQHMVSGAVALLIVLGLIQVINEIVYYTTQSQLKDNAKLLLERSQRLTTLQASLPKLQSDSNLKAQLKQVEKDLISKQRVLSVLSNKKLGNTSGFTQQFTGLARQTIQGLWITRAHFIQGGTVLDIQGKSNHPDLVPKYLQALSSEEAFKGTEFNSFIIQKNTDNNILEFKFNNILSEKSNSNHGLLR